MLEDKIITLDNGIQYYIFDSVQFEYEKYILCARCDLEKDEIDIQNLLIKKVVLKNDNIAIDDVEEPEKITEVTTLLLKKVQENN